MNKDNLYLSVFKMKYEKDKNNNHILQFILNYLYLN